MQIVFSNLISYSYHKMVFLLQFEIQQFINEKIRKQIFSVYFFNIYTLNQSVDYFLSYFLFFNNKNYITFKNLILHYIRSPKISIPNNHNMTEQLPQTKTNQSSKQQYNPITAPSTTLSTKKLFNHYFLIHDFLLRMVKNQSSNAKYFDLQIQVNDSMRKAANVGGKFGQIGVFSSLLLYCMKGNTIKLKLLYGFLYIYWIDHFYTLGSYLGVLLRMPSVYKKVGEHFTSYQPITQNNLFVRLNQEMQKNQDYEETQQLLNRIFQQETLEQKSYVTNDFFAKNKDKYFTHDEGTLIERPTMKLKYMDCFLTRYFYYSFTRWYQRKLTSWGLIKQGF